MVRTVKQVEGQVGLRAGLWMGCDTAFAVLHPPLHMPQGVPCPARSRAWRAYWAGTPSRHCGQWATISATSGQAARYRLAVAIGNPPDCAFSDSWGVCPE